MKNNSKNPQSLQSNFGSANVILLAARRISRLIISEKKADQLVSKTCSILEETAGVRGAWIILMDDSGAAYQYAENGFGKQFASLYEITRDGNAVHCITNAGANGSPAAIRNRPEVCAGCPLVQHHPKSNALSSRLMHKNVVLGHITVLVDEHYFKDPEFKSLLHDVAEDISYALHILKTDYENTPTEKKLFATKERLQATLDASEGGIFTKDKNGVFVDVNLSFAKFYAVTPDKLIGMTDYDLLPKEEADALWKTDQKVLQTGKIYRSEGVNTVRGEKITALTTKVPLRDENGDIIGLVGFVENITQREKAKKALIESEERFRNAFRTSPDSININRLEDGLFVDINEGFTHITGYTREETIGKTSIELGIWFDPKIRRKLAEELKRNGRVENLKSQFRMKNGTLRTALISATLFNIKGVPHILSVTRAIDDILQAEEALKESEQRFHILFEESPIPLWEEDFSNIKLRINKLEADGVDDFADYVNTHDDFVIECVQNIKIIDINHAVLDLYNASSKKEVKKWIIDNVAGSSLNSWRQQIISICNNKSELSFETSIATVAGETKDISLKWMAVPGYKESLSRVIIAMVDITESKRSVESIKKTKKLLVDAQRAGRVGSWQKDAVSGELWWSDGAYHVFGYDPQIAASPKDLYRARIHPNDLDFVLRAYKTAVQEKTHYNIVFRIQTLKGEMRYIRERCETTYKDGRPLNSIGTVQDISDAKRTEDALTQAMTQYRNLFEQSNDGIYLLYENKFERINPKFQDLFGYSLQECNAPDFHFMNLVAEESKPIIKERMRKFSAGDHVDPVYEFTAISKDGKRIKCEASVSRFRYKSGFATQGIIRDIGARKRAEEELRKLLQAVEQSPAAVVITDLKGRIEYVNPRFVSITGYSFEDVKEKLPHILQPDVSDETRIAEIWDTIAEGDVWEGEYQNVRKNGEFYWEDVAISPIFSDQGLITHYLYIGEDITDKKELEEQFRQSQKMEAVGQLAGGVAHDFNNLLTIINGYSEMLLATLDSSSPHYNGINQIKQAGLRAESLTRQLLAFSRKQILQPKVLDINDLIYNMEKMLGRLIGEDIDLATIYDSSLRRVKVDPGQFEQVVLNLAINARDAMPLGGTLTIETHNELFDSQHPLLRKGGKAGWYVSLLVTDTGEGMDKETIERIFEPFYTTKGNGTGLGLSTVYGIIKQSGGLTAVDSRPGCGATFKIYFPAVEEITENGDDASQRAEAQARQGTILVTEDEDSVRELATLALQQIGYTVLTAENGVAALDVLEKHDDVIDLLLTDVIMPKMGGKELADNVLQRKPEIKVLFMSGYTDDSIVNHGVLEEGTNFIQKPFTPDRLIRKIYQVLGDAV